MQDETHSSGLLVLLWFILGPTALFLVAVSSDTNLAGSDRMALSLGALVSTVALLGTAVTFWRAHPIGLATCIALTFLPAGAVAWATGEHFGVTTAALFLSGSAPAGYIMWRHVGFATVVDRVTDYDYVYDVQAVHLGWDAEQSRQHVRFQVQNIRNDVATIELRILPPRGRQASRIEHVQRLQPGEAGTIQFALPKLEAASATWTVAVRVRHSKVVARRLFLEPRRPFPVGPAWVFSLLSIVDWSLFASFKRPVVQAFRDISPRDGPSTPATRWIPDPEP